MSHSETKPSEVLNFWLSEQNSQKWFVKDPAFDSEIRSKFGSLAAQARSNDLDNWTSTPEGTLALLILLDQFSRNLHRGSRESYAADAKALGISIEAIAKGDELQMPLLSQFIFYLPLVHNESLVSQVAAKALYEGYLRRCEASGDEKVIFIARAGLDACIKHLEVIRRFGRYPGRNDALGRVSTEEEKIFLRDEPQF